MAKPLSRLPPPTSDPPSPPFIPIPSLANLRDVASSIPIPRHVLFRSADPSQVDLSGLQSLAHDHSITTIFDLRSEPEIANHGGVQDWEATIARFNAAGGKKVQRHWTPVFKAEDYGPEAVAMRFRDYGAEDDEGFVRAYEAILEHGKVAFAKIITHMAQEGCGGTLVHCTAGKDRTGVLVAVILAAAGFAKDQIGEEYQLTEIGMADRRPMLIARLVSTGAFGEGEAAERAAERMTGSRKQSMVKTLHLVDQKYGGPVAYLKECGIQPHHIDALVSKLKPGGGPVSSNL